MKTKVHVARKVLICTVVEGYARHFWVQSNNFGKLTVYRCANCGATAGIVGGVL